MRKLTLAEPRRSPLSYASLATWLQGRGVEVWMHEDYTPDSENEVEVYEFDNEGGRWGYVDADCIEQAITFEPTPVLSEQSVRAACVALDVPFEGYRKVHVLAVTIERARS